MKMGSCRREFGFFTVGTAFCRGRTRFPAPRGVPPAGIGHFFRDPASRRRAKDKFRPHLVADGSGVGHWIDPGLDSPGKILQLRSKQAQGTLTIENPDGCEQVKADGLPVANTKDHTMVNEGPALVRFLRCAS